MNRNFSWMLFIVLLAPVTVSAQKPKQAEEVIVHDEASL